jgi:hypothetical protein
MSTDKAVRRLSRRGFPAAAVLFVPHAELSAFSIPSRAVREYFGAQSMPGSKLRQHIAWEAARLMYDRQESEYFQAKQKAARRLCGGWVKPADLPSNAEIRDQVQLLARLHEGESRFVRLREMRVAALGLMQRLERFRPRLIGSVLTGHIREGSDVDVHVFSDSVEAVCHALEQEARTFEVQRKLVRKHGEATTYVHIHVAGKFPIELTVYPAEKATFVFTSSITGKPIERASAAQLRKLLEQEHPGLDLDAELAGEECGVDRFQLFTALLLPLENVKQPLRYHPEGDALYHSLQVFDEACQRLPYDEEFLAAALLHDVGKAIDPFDHVAAGLEALEGALTPRTAWLIENHMLAHEAADGTLGRRARRRLQEHEWFEDLMLLEECDRAGRRVGVVATELEAAIDYLRNLEANFG